jgi:hypothetical protein
MKRGYKPAGEMDFFRKNTGKYLFIRVRLLSKRFSQTERGSGPEKSRKRTVLRGDFGGRWEERWGVRQRVSEV